MINSRKNLIIIVSSLLLVSLAVCISVTLLKKENNNEINYNEEYVATFENESAIFYNLNDYLSYLAAQPQTLSNTESSTNLWENEVPDDFSISSIEVNNEGTIFTYDISRKNVNLFGFTTDDDALLEMATTFISKEYNYSFVSNERLYAENLAACTGATCLTSCDTHAIYAGTVYVDLHNVETGTTERVAIGDQKVIFGADVAGSNTGTVYYYFVPATMTEAEFNSYANISSIIGTNN